MQLLFCQDLIGNTAAWALTMLCILTVFATYALITYLITDYFETRGDNKSGVMIGRALMLIFIGSAYAWAAINDQPIFELKPLIVSAVAAIAYMIYYYIILKRDKIELYKQKAEQRIIEAKNYGRYMLINNAPIFVGTLVPVVIAGLQNLYLTLPMAVITIGITNFVSLRRFNKIRKKC